MWPGLSSRFTLNDNFSRTELRGLFLYFTHSGFQNPAQIGILRLFSDGNSWSFSKSEISDWIRFGSVHLDGVLKDKPAGGKQSHAATNTLIARSSYSTQALLYRILGLLGIDRTLLSSQLTAIDFHSIFFHTMEVNGYRQLFGHQHSSKYNLFVLNRRKKLIQVWNNLKVRK